MLPNKWPSNRTRTLRLATHAIAILTEWREFAKLDYETIFKDMVKPAFIFDGRNILDHRRLYELGFNVYAVGKAPLTHFGNGDSGLGI